MLSNKLTGSKMVVSMCRNGPEPRPCGPKSAGGWCDWGSPCRLQAPNSSVMPVVPPVLGHPDPLALPGLPPSNLFPSTGIFHEPPPLSCLRAPTLKSPTPMTDALCQSGEGGMVLGAWARSVQHCRVARFSVSPRPWPIAIYQRLLAVRRP